MAASGINPKQVNDLHSFSDYVQPLMEFMEYSVPSSISIKQEEKVILVGHSLGGVPEVTAYILTAKGTSTNFMFGPRYISSNLYDLSSPEDLDLASMLARPIRIFSADDMSKQMTMSKQKYGSVKRVYIIAELDKGIPKDVQRWVIEKDSVDDVKEIGGSDHMVMMSRPHELFACLQEIAGEA
ncbi:salicylic acid-binding protein 2-like [Papaver somniferum]|uniref:salicylic acid-binding protein 2-like n=1 Tax=Papaver somniferum TaxID=3469 RepID=UPI000E6FBAE5|nr:salicylic acid-binding protein 2-like [Papaver somniferum]